jgi:hypothetical protein
MMVCCLTGRVYLVPHSVQVAIAPIPAIVVSSHRYDVCMNDVCMNDVCMMCAASRGWIGNDQQL